MAYGINNSGIITGTAYNWSNTDSFAFKSDNGGALTKAGGVRSTSRAINDKGETIGSEMNIYTPVNVFRGVNESVVFDPVYSPFALNNLSQVAGYSSATRHGFWWDSNNNVFVDIGALAPGGHSQASDINDYGLVVGISTKDSSTDFAFTWYNNVMQELMSPYNGSVANAVNNKKSSSRLFFI